MKKLSEFICREIPPEMRVLAERAAEAQKRNPKTPAEVEAWAARLAADVANAND